MCGIFGYIGHQNVHKTTLAGLKRLEYRGYDSSGLAGLSNGELHIHKERGKIAALMPYFEGKDIPEYEVAISHTRWATHGEPSQKNAHPHANTTQTMALVHNGIIENYDNLRTYLEEHDIEFKSETDTEVLVQLISHLYQGDILKAVQEALPMCQGAWAIALIHKDYPGQIITAAQGSPLAIGVGNNEVFISSDTNAFMTHTRNVFYVHDGEVAVITKDKYEVFDANAAQISKETEKLEQEVTEAVKGNFEHFMLKEIFEQPQVIRNTLLSRFLPEYGTAKLDGITIDVNELLSVDRIIFLACGTSWHAAYIGAYILEERARIPTQVEISSEYRYKNPIVTDNTLVIAISQSGETADTLAAMRELKAKGARVIAISNVQGSTLTREADCTLLLRAGQEVGVAATKTFISQVTVISLFALQMARMRHMSKHEGQDFLHALEALPDQVQQILDKASDIESLGKKYADFENFFFLGRQHMYPASLEGALKLKEISYINATGYPAGEMKHGPIALISPECPTVALCAHSLTYDKLVSNLMEVKARKGPIIAVADQRTKGIDEIADDIFRVPETINDLAPILSVIVTQLFAYYVAKARGAEIDQPRNLAKSVTVE
jgi:glucosamine--fructose-6-phosphate aminotransferase (isomerizing)